MIALIVDDVDELRAALSDVLQLEGVVVLEAADGEEALRKLADVDGRCVVILDLHMPKIDGASLMRIMRSGRFRLTPIIFLTACPNEAPPGFVTLAKPVDVATLMRHVGQAWVAISEGQQGRPPTPVRQSVSR